MKSTTQRWVGVVGSVSLGSFLSWGGTTHTPLVSLWITCLNTHFLLTGLAKTMEVEVWQGEAIGRLFKTTKEWVRVVHFSLSFQIFLATSKRGECILRILFKQHRVIVQSTRNTFWSFVVVFVATTVVFIYFIIFGMWVAGLVFGFISVTYSVCTRVFIC